MLLKDKNAIVYEARGYVGSHVARAFARDGARVFLAGDLGPQGIRVVCLRPEAIPETWAGDHIEVRTYMEDGTALGRLPTLDEVANAAVFIASDRASAMIGTVANLTCGSIMD